MSVWLGVGRLVRGNATLTGKGHTGQSRETHLDKVKVLLREPAKSVTQDEPRGGGRVGDAGAPQVLLYVDIIIIPPTLILSRARKMNALLRMFNAAARFHLDATSSCSACSRCR